MRPEHWLFTIPLRLRSLFRWEQADQELDDELRDHLERKIEEYVAKGMAPEEARRRARLDLGGIEQTKEKCRDARRVNWIQDFVQDLRYGLRMLRKSPGFTAVAILTVALGIGANVAIFSLINAVMLRSLPVHSPEQLVFLRWVAHRSPKTHMFYSWAGCPGNAVFSSTGAGSCSFSYPAYEQIRQNQTVFSGVFGFIPASGLSDVTVNGQTARGRGDLVSGNFFSTLGVGSAAGRTLDPLDDVSGAAPVVVFSSAYWQSRFGGDAAIVGKTVLLNGIPFTVAGVAAPGFAGLETGVPQQFWVPLSARYQIDQRFPKEKETDSASMWVQMGARLKPGTSLIQAEATLGTIFARSVTSGPEAPFKAEDEPRIELPSATHGLPTLRQEFSKPLFALMSAVCLILSIACANVAGLMLARAVARQKEISVRVALGAARWRIVRQLLTESLMLAVAGGGLGILFAYWGAGSLSGLLSANADGAWEINVSPDLRILGFALGISGFVGILSGLAPALRGTRLDLIPALKESDTGLSRSVSASGRRFSVGSGLVVAQVALSILVLSGAGLLVRTLVNLQTTNTGFDARNILLFGVDTTLSHYKEPKLQSLYRDLQQQFAALPGVISASYCMTPLLSGARSATDLQIPDAPDKSSVNVDLLPVGPDFFQTMRIPFLTGRMFTPEEFESSSQPQPIIVNQSFTRRFFGKGNPLGRTVSEPGGKTPQYKIIGVVGDAKYDSLRRDVAPTAYLPIGYGGGSFEIRTAMNPKALIPAAREVLHKIDENLFLLDAKTQVEQIDQSLFQERLLASLSSLFAVLALTLACIGLYGLLSYEVTRRAHEIGVRMALGAPQRDVLCLVVARGALLVLLGSAAGIAAALGVTRYIESFLYGVKPIDPWTFAAIALLLFAVALAACYVPARRATRVDPMIALRYE